MVHATADGAPPGVGNLARGPIVVFQFASVRCPSGDIAGEGKTGMESEGRKQC